MNLAANLSLPSSHLCLRVISLCFTCLIGYITGVTPVSAGSLSLTTTGSSFTVSILERYEAVLTTNDTTDYLLFKDKQQDKEFPDTTHEFIGPYLREAGTDYQLRYDDTRVTTLLESSESRVRIMVQGCLDTAAGSDCLTDGTTPLELTEYYTFTEQGMWVHQSIDFKSSGIALDNSSYNDGYHWMWVDVDMTDAAFLDTNNIYYGDGSTEISTNTDGFIISDVYPYVVLPGHPTGSYQSAIIAVISWFNQPTGNDDWYWDINASSTTDQLFTREQGTTATGLHYSTWYFMMQDKNTLQNETKRKSLFNDFDNPDNLDDGLISPAGTGSGWDETQEQTDVDTDDYFNEHEGVYALQADSSELKFDLDGDTYSRFRPFVKFRHYYSNSKPADARLEGIPLLDSADYNISAKPISLALFANEVLWHSTMQSSAVFTNPDIGSGSSAGSATFVSGKYGNGMQVDANNEEPYFPSANNISGSAGSIEFWYQNTSTPASTGVFFAADDGAGTVNMELARGGADTDIDFTIDDGSAHVNSWNSTTINLFDGNWHHVKLIYDAATDTPELYLDTVEQTQDAFSAWTAITVQTNIYVGDVSSSDRNIGGIIDEVWVYGSSASSLTPIAQGGDTNDSAEYLADPSNDYTFSFTDDDTANRAEYIFFGSDSSFHGLNIDLATLGVEGTSITFEWEYWDSSAWSSLSVSESQTDTSKFLADGTISWSSPSNWAGYSINGSPDLYFIRGHLETGSYSTAPIEDTITSDIITFQLLSTITTADQSLSIPGEDPYLTFTVAGVAANAVHNEITSSVASTISTIPFGNLAIASPKFAAQELFVQTNSGYGYTVDLRLVDANLQGVYPSNEISPFQPGGITWTSPTAWTSPTGTTKNVDTGWFGANTTDTRVPGWNTSPEGKFGPVLTTDNTVMYSSTADDDGSTVYVSYGIEVNGYQPADIYSGELMYTVIPTY